MTSSAEHPSGTRSRVLIVDDSPDVHRLLKARLKQEEIEIISVESGLQGLEEVRKQRPSIVLLDLDMPGMDGFEFLRCMKEDSTTHHIPVVILSAMSNPQDKVAAFDLGAHDFVTKPFELTELRVRIRAALRMNALLHMLSQRAQIDGLTGLWNRAYFDQRVQDEVARVQRHPGPLSVAFMDADHFKSINDTFGHPAGDAVLQGIGRTLLRSIRQTDVACRYGGEEFVLIMPATTPEDAHALCDRIRATIEALVWPRHPERRVTVSMGVAGSGTGAGLTAASWIEAADRCVYSAKQSGRNRVVTNDLSAAKTAAPGSGVESAPLRKAG